MGHYYPWKEEGSNWNHYYHWKKNHKLDLNDKIEDIKTLTKEQRKKIKSRRSESKNIIYTN
jgi:hypothetical protein